MVKAGALPYAILISLLVLSFCSILILFSLFNSKLFIQEIQERKIDDNLESALNIIMTQSEPLNYNQPKRLSIFGDSSSVCSTKISRWGAYDLVSIGMKTQRKTQVKAALLGSMYERKALIMRNQNDYLFVSGSTKIIGDCWVPGGFVKSTTIEGNQYNGVKTVDGIVNKSESKLPELHPSLINPFDYQIKSDSTILFDQVKGKQIVNSFSNKTLILSTDNDILLSNTLVKGNVVVKSSRKVEIDSSCRLSDIIIYAASVKINRSFKGTIQVFAKDSIIVDENCIFLYPSFIATTGDNPKQIIKIAKGSVIHGGVLLQNTSTNPNSNSKILLKKSSVVNGIVYSNTIVELQGGVKGSVYTNEFTINSGSSIYKNILLNAYINALELNKFFLSPNIFNETSEKGLIAWLY